VRNNRGYNKHFDFVHNEPVIDITGFFSIDEIRLGSNDEARV